MIAINNEIAAFALRQMAKTASPCKIKINGVSMLPILKNGETAVVKYSPYVHTGDIALCEYNGGFLLHRVIYADEKTLITKGDNSFSTETIPIDHIIGHVIGFELTEGCEYRFRKCPLLDYLIVLLSRKVDRYRKKGNKIEKTKRTISYQMLYFLSACCRRLSKRAAV